MFCEECGKKLIRPQALYCPYCGHKVNHEPSVNPAQPAESTAPAPQTVSPESDAQGVPVAVSMQVSESPIESMPELQPIVPDTVEEAAAEEAVLEEPPQAVRARAAAVRPAAARKLRRVIFFIFKHSSIDCIIFHVCGGDAIHRSAGERF